MISFQDVKAGPSKIDLQRELAEKQMKVFEKQEALIDIQTEYYKAKLALLRQGHANLDIHPAEPPNQKEN